MDELSDSHLKKLNTEGFLCGPKEMEDNFLKRVELLKSMDPFLRELKALNRHSLGLLSLPSFDLKISWLQGLIKTSLVPWVAGQTTIYEYNQLEVPLITVKDGRKKKEALQHEAFHAVRCAFEEPIFEEILAFQTSPSLIRRYSGALFRGNKEIALFIGAICFSFLSSFSPIASEVHHLILCFPWIVLFLFSLRLIKYQRLLKKALKGAQKIFVVGDPLSVITRLQDQEILLLASGNLVKIKSYIKDQSSLRWRQILASYPLKTFNH